MENYGVFIAGDANGALHPRREGRRVLLRAIDDVERRFSEPVFSRTSTSLQQSLRGSLTDALAAVPCTQCSAITRQLLTKSTATC